MRTGMQMRIRQRERGQSMVELTLILPFLLLLLVATVEAGFALRDYLMVQSVNREGARLAIRTPPGEEYRGHFSDEDVPDVFDRISVAAQEGGLRGEGISIIVTHIYIDTSDSAVYETFTDPPTLDPGRSRLDAQALADSNATKTAEINTLRSDSEYGRLSNEVVVVETFYEHRSLWLYHFIGPLGGNWTMYAKSTMRMVGTGR